MELTEGSDRSHYQGAPTSAARLDRFLNAGRCHVGIKMSEGTYGSDSTFDPMRALLRSRGVCRWLYHEATNETVSRQVDHIMALSGGHLYPRERVALVLGDFSVSRTNALALASALEDEGPIKRVRTKESVRTFRPKVLLYANSSNWRTTYKGMLDVNPKIVAAYPGDPTYPDIPNVVMHQDSHFDPDPGLGGDHDIFYGDAAAVLHFFRDAS